MKRLWPILGRAIHAVCWPLIIVYLHRSERTRLLLMVDGKVLVVRGWLSDGRWELPGGGLHPGESPASGVLRELREETGIRLPSTNLKPLGEWRHQRGPLYATYYGFIARQASQPQVKRQRPEIVASKWLHPAELTPANATAEVLELLNRVASPVASHH